MKYIKAKRSIPTAIISATRIPPSATGDLIGPIWNPLLALRLLCERFADGVDVRDDVVDVDVDVDAGTGVDDTSVEIGADVSSVGDGWVNSVIGAMAIEGFEMDVVAKEAVENEAESEEVDTTRRTKISCFG